MASRRLSPISAAQLAYYNFLLSGFPLPLPHHYSSNHSQYKINQGENFNLNNRINVLRVPSQ